MKIDLLVDIRSSADPPAGPTRLPAIERCLARGEAIEPRDATFPATLLTEYGLAPLSAPYAAITLVGDGEDPADHYWLRADPISLMPTMHNLTGGALHEGELEWSEARARADVLGPHLHEAGYALVVKHPLRWYLRCASPQNLHTVAPPTEPTMLDESLLPSGPDGPRWQRLMTEAQMLLFASELDQAREADRRRPVNGVWIWGGGCAPHIDRRPYAKTYSDDALASGLARLSGTALAPPPDSADALALDREDDAILVALSPACVPNLRALDARWVAPCSSLVARGLASELRLRVFHAGGAFGCRVTRSLLRRWWRRARPLVDHA